jgi:hypothetical protein
MIPDYDGIPDLPNPGPIGPEPGTTSPDFEIFSE